MSKIPHIHEGAVETFIGADGTRVQRVIPVATHRVAVSISDVLGVVSEMMGAVPIINDVQVGVTGYLDRFTVRDLVAPVCRGVDPHGRAFVALAVVAASRDEIEVVTLFQRYAGEAGESVVVEASPEGTVICLGALDRAGLNRLRTLLRGYFVSANEYCEPRWLATVAELDRARDRAR